MGLDCYFVKSVAPGDTAELVEFDAPEPALCGGMFSGNGACGSFRGKVYADFVQAVCGISLYEELTSEQLLEAGNDIKEWLNENQDEKFTFGYELTRQELTDLGRCFRAYGEAGFGTHAWY